MNSGLRHVAAQFADGFSEFAITPLGNGLINDTYLVKGIATSFVLQRLNADVFPEPRKVLNNLAQLGQHIREKAANSVRLQIPDIIPTRLGDSLHEDENNRIWRALELIQPAESRNSIRHADEAAQIGFALAHFHRLCADLPAESLHDTLPGFHVTPGYLQQYQHLMAQPLNVTIDDSFRRCQAFIDSHRHDAYILENARNSGELKDKVIHGDPKLNNFLFKPGTHRVVSLIDLDTVKPGLLHYDIADCLRSCCHDRESNRFDLERCQIILENYLQEANDFFRANDYDYLYAAIWLIPFELGLRFFNDYLNGNRYFKVTEPRQNLNRALAQFALCDSIEQQQASLQRCIRRLKGLHLRR